MGVLASVPSTGIRLSFGPTEYRTPEARQMVAVDGGFFVVYESGDVVAFRDDFTKAPVNVGRGLYLVDTGAAGRVWIAGGSECAECKSVEWYEAGLDGST